MSIVLDDPNESFTNDTSIVENGGIAFISSDHNALVNTGVLWGLGATADTIIVGMASTAATVTNSASGYIRGGHLALAVVGNDATIINSGQMVGDQNGIAIVGARSDVNNDGGGSIKGGNLGISLEGGPESQINNFGYIYGGNAGVTMFAGTLTNGGEVGGDLAGVRPLSGTIVNGDFGIIWSLGNAIEALVGRTTITNQSGGLIDGLVTAIKTDASATISLDNAGKINGLIDLNAVDGKDRIVNTGKINGDVFLGPGHDTFNGAGGISGKVFGEGGDDTITGGFAKDVLDGGAGKDKIGGGLGKDQLSGGADRDLFDFNSVRDSVKGSKRDVINDFKHGNNVTGDDIDLRDIDARSGVKGNQAFKFIGEQGFHHVKGELHYKDLGASCLVQGDVNGDGKADFEILVKVSSLSASDFLL